MVWLYVVRQTQGWSMRMSLDWRVDVRYWMPVRQFGGHHLAEGTRMVLWREAIPVDIALQVVERFRSSKEMTSWQEEHWQIYGEEMMQSFHERMNRLHGTMWSQVIVISRHAMVEDAQHLMRKASELTISSHMYEQLMHGLEGRELLESEVRSMGAQFGRLAVDREQLFILLQLGMLEQRIKFMNGVAWRNKRGIWEVLLSRLKRLGCMAIDIQGSHREINEERCRRCGSTGAQLRVSYCERCGAENCYTCLACLQLASSRSCGLLIAGVRSVVNQSGRLNESLIRRGQAEESIEVMLDRFGLAPAQRDASQRALCYLEERWNDEADTKGEFLLWAVTGAGKTEMMFPLVAYALARGGRVCIATPRRDVVLELKPRITKAFDGVRVVTLYGGSEERWESGEVTLTTTHQLMRFRDAFDLVVVDELDAFPYHNNPMLERAARRACAPGGTFVYLSATPPKAMQQAVRRGRLAQAIVPVRYHREPLPVPRRLAMMAVARLVCGGQLPNRLAQVIRQSIERGAQLFVFAARIRHMDGIVRLLRASLPQYVVEGTFAADAKRTEKVQRFRKGDIRVLVTTTILERGVTVPKSDVLILDAGDKLFDASSLVQMAGRAGRSKDDPHGLVYFVAPEWTRAQREAVRQIKQMNRLAKRGGYLRESGSK